MSIKIMNRVWQDSKQKAGYRLALLSIADNADDHGLAFPGLATIAKKCGISERAAIFQIQGLAASGELLVFKKSGYVNMYVVATSMSWADYKAALKRLMDLRKTSIADLSKGRKLFTRESTHTIIDRGVKRASGVLVKTASPEPSVKPSTKLHKDITTTSAAAERGPLLDAIVAACRMNSTLPESYALAGRILKKLPKNTTAEAIKRAAAWWHSRKENRGKTLVVHYLPALMCDTGWHDYAAPSEDKPLSADTSYISGPLAAEVVH